MNKNELVNLSQAALLKILEVTQKLAAPLDLDSILDEVIDASKFVLNADKAIVWLYDSKHQEMVIKVPKMDPAIRVARGIGLVGECLSTRQLINVVDCKLDGRFNAIVDKETAYTTQSILSIPLIGGNDEMVGVLQLLNKQGGAFNYQDELIATSFAAQCSVALIRAQMTKEIISQKRIKEEVAIAREIQMTTLPTEMPVIDGYDLHGLFLPADQTGGDMFDLVMHDGQLFILLGDATGHGFGPALSATQMLAMFRVSFRLGADLDSAYIHVNNQMVEDLPDDRFVTAFLGFLDPNKHFVQYHSAGQGPLLHFVAKSKECNWFAPTSFPLGAMELSDGLGDHKVHLGPGDILALISDGVYEYMNAEGSEFGEQRVSKIMTDNQHLSMRELSEKLVNEAIAYGGDEPQLDDITVVLIKRH